jgi:hypothetical protein
MYRLIKMGIRVLREEKSRISDGLASAALELDLLAPLSRGVVPHGSKQLIGSHPFSWSVLSKVLRVVPTKIKHPAGRIQSVASRFKSGEMKRALHGLSIVGCSGPRNPVYAWVSSGNAFSEKNPEIEDHVKAAQVALPWLEAAKEDLHRLVVAQIWYERSAVSGQPSGDRGKAILAQVRGYTESSQEAPECIQSVGSMLHEVSEIISAASDELFHFLIGKMTKTVRSLPVRWLIGGIIRQGLQHTTAVISEVARFAAQPAEHAYLREQWTVL